MYMKEDVLSLWCKARFKWNDTERPETAICKFLYIFVIFISRKINYKRVKNLREVGE